MMHKAASSKKIPEVRPGYFSVDVTLVPKGTEDPSTLEHVFEEASSLEEAQKLFMSHAQGLGSVGTIEGTVYNDKGKAQACFTSDGKIWDVAAKNKPMDKELALVPTGELVSLKPEDTLPPMADKIVKVLGGVAYLDILLGVDGYSLESIETGVRIKPLAEGADLYAEVTFDSDSGLYNVTLWAKKSQKVQEIDGVYEDNLKSTFEKLISQHPRTASIKMAELALSPADKKVVDAFTDKKPMSSKKLVSDGKVLSGLWMGGTGIAKWNKGKIEMPDLGGKAAQTVQKFLKKNTPKNFLAPEEVTPETLKTALDAAWDKLDFEPKTAKIKLADLVLSPADKKVVDAFTDKKTGSSKKLDSDGTVLNGMWMGGSNIAKWVDGKIEMPDLGSKAAQTVQRYLKRNTPKSFLKLAANAQITSTYLMKKFPELSLEDAERFAKSFTTVRGSNEADKILGQFSSAIGGYGVEAIQEEGSYNEPAALYVNLGDTYDTTLVYDVEEDEYLVMSWGDWVHEAERSGRSMTASARPIYRQYQNRTKTAALVAQLPTTVRGWLAWKI